MHRWLERFRPVLTRLTVAAVIVSFGLASTGYPIWSEGVAKDTSQPFPCMHRKCGCRTAEQCWKGCCCFTNREKLDWAKKQKVRVPDYVAVAAAREKPTTQTASCCSTKSQSCCKTTKPVAKKQGSVQFVSIVEALTCQGHVEQWVSAGAVFVTLPEPFAVDLPCCGHVAILSESLDSLSLAPPSPIPWC